MSNDEPEYVARIRDQLRPDGLSELDKFQENAAGFEAVTLFVDWLRGNGMQIGLTPMLPGARLIPLDDHPEEFACALYDIDYARLCEDRAEYIRQYNEESNS